MNEEDPERDRATPQEVVVVEDEEGLFNADTVNEEDPKRLFKDRHAVLRGGGPPVAFSPTWSCTYVCARARVGV